MKKAKSYTVKISREYLNELINGIELAYNTIGKIKNPEKISKESDVDLWKTYKTLEKILTR